MKSSSLSGARGPFVFERQSCRLHAWTAGDPDHPAVVLTHGFTMDHHLFDDQVDALAKDHHVVVWDVRGHGLSKPLGGTFTIGRATDDLRAVLDGLGIHRAAHVGHSMGGYIAQELAFQAPDRVTALATISSTCLTQGTPGAVRWGGTTTTAMLQAWPHAWTTAQIGWIAGMRRATRAGASRSAALLTKDERVRVWNGILHGYRDAPGHRVRCPLLVMRGQFDYLVGFGLIARLAPQFARTHRGCRYEVVPWAGHNANVDNPGFTNRVLREFLADALGGHAARATHRQRLVPHVSENMAGAA